MSIGEVLVIGGGIAGIQAAIDLADMGFKVYLVERKPSIGGRMAQLDKTFPTLDCASCILAPKMAEVARNPNIEIISNAEVISLVREKSGVFKATIKKYPRYVDEAKCTGCKACVEKCPAKDKLGAPDEFNEGLSMRKAVYIPFPQALPLKAIIDPNICLYFKLKSCRLCEKVCPTGAINFNDIEKIINLYVNAVIVATGYKFVDPRHPALSLYGYGKYPNVYTNIEFERLLDARGPTGGVLLRRSDKRHPKRIVFIQCVGSRDYRINPYCSAYCCMASIKQAILAKEHDPEVDTVILYMDIRAFGKGFQEFYERAIEEFKIKFIRGRPVKIIEDDKTKNLIVAYEDTLKGTIEKIEADMVVLALGIVPNTPAFLADLGLIEDGRPKTLDPQDPIATPIEGIYVAGMITGPKDIPDSVAQGSAAAVRAATYAISRREVVAYAR
ncbi:MAG: CoB--CoM heterodisulfide reductase iron-sulfur subunit A family protein [Acidilobaceae archaeon]